MTDLGILVFFNLARRRTSLLQLSPSRPPIINKLMEWEGLGHSFYQDLKSRKFDIILQEYRSILLLRIRTTRA
jgi:hypothetical protein